MSPFEHVRWVRGLTAVEIGSTDRLVLMMLATYCDKQSVCFPSVDLLAANCSLTTRGVRLSLARLREAGRIEVVGRGPKGVNRIHLNVVHPEPDSGQGVNEVQVDPEQGSAKESREGSKGRVQSPSPDPSRWEGDPAFHALVSQVQEVLERWEPPPFEEEYADLLASGSLTQQEMERTRKGWEEWVVKNEHPRAWPMSRWMEGLRVRKRGQPRAEEAVRYAVGLYEGEKVDEGADVIELADAVAERRDR